MEEQFINIKLPKINLTKVKWPTLKKVSSHQIETKAMELHPVNFGNLLNQPFRTCEDLWQPILTVKIYFSNKSSN